MFRAIKKSLTTPGTPPLPWPWRVAGVAGIYAYVCYSNPEKFRRDRDRVVVRIEELKNKDKQLEERPKDSKCN
jgi:hypothetical protein